MKTPLISIKAILLLLSMASTTLVAAADDDDTNVTPETSEESAAEEKRIESLPMPPTQFEIEEDLKEAKTLKQSAERRSKAFSSRLAGFEQTMKGLTAFRENFKATKEALIALRQEMDAQISTNKASPEKLKSIVANLKPVLDEKDDFDRLDLINAFERRAAPADKDIVAFAVRLGPRMADKRSVSNEDFLASLKESRKIFPSDDSIAQIPDVLQKTAENLKRWLIDSQKSASTVAAAWAKRYSTLSEQLRKLQSAAVSSVVASLPWLMGILALFGVAAIFLVRFFPEAVQVEWVVSGQVIQLLTVVTLLLIILCLALTSIIKEETIGTLLGGIGGYVLSQGIGRAAGRAAARAASTTS